MPRLWKKGYTIDRIYELTKIDPWFLGKLKNIVDYKQKLSNIIRWKTSPPTVLREAKVLGFSDFQIARFVLNPQGNMEKENLAVRARRKALDILPAVKRINTVASEHPELTNYLYMTYAVRVMMSIIIRMKNQWLCLVRALTASVHPWNSTGAL